MKRVAICDDDIGFINNIMKPMMQEVVKRLKTHIEITYYYNSVDLLASFSLGVSYDIVILDIDMPSINGKELSRKLREIDGSFSLAFMSAYKEEVYSTIPIGISAFIPKDFDKNKCLNSITELISNYNCKSPEYDFFDVLKNGVKSTRKFLYDSIYYFSNEFGIITLHTSSEDIIMMERIFNTVVSKYESHGFYKSHRNYLVNLNKIYEVSDKNLVLDNNVKIPVSKRNRKALLKELAGSVASKIK